MTPSDAELIERLQFIADNAATVIPEEIEEVCTEAVEKYKAAILNADTQNDLKAQIEDLKRENERLRLEHIPKPCNCGAYRGQLTGGWECPVHGQQW